MSVSISTYWRTVRHLKPIQIWGRIWNHLPRPGPRRIIGLVPRPMVRTWKVGVVREAEMEGPRTFRLLNQKRVLMPGEWEPAGTSRLWKYHLHYFNDLNAKGAEKRRKWHKNLITSWIQENPPGQGTGWEPYPTSRRIANWVKYFCHRQPAESEWLDSLAVQADWLSKRLEWHLLGNHLVANAKALLFAGLYFQGEEAERWRKKGSAVLEQQIQEQVLADGGHFELSPMYHLLILEDFIDIAWIHGRFGKPRPRYLEETIKKMLRWSMVMRHPDGEIPFFNDACMGVAPKPKTLEQYAKKIGLKKKPEKPKRVEYLKNSGYVRLQKGNATLFADLGEIGPSYQPGHAHADTFSFELSLEKKRVVVNGGTSVYGDSRDRSRQRGSMAHSTAVVDGIDSSEMWATFRVGRRAHILRRRVWSEPGQVAAEGSHDGYRHLMGRPRLERKWCLQPKALYVNDRILCPKKHRLESILILGNRLRPHKKTNQSVVISSPSKKVLCTVRAENDTVCYLEPTTWHPEFNLAIPTWRLRFASSKPSHENRFSIRW